MRYVFNEVGFTVQKSGKCGCGKRRTRSQKFWQTLNPYNRNDDGSPKTAHQIHIELDAQADAWKLEPITCDVCKSTHPTQGASR